MDLRHWSDEQITAICRRLPAPLIDQASKDTVRAVLRAAEAVPSDAYQGAVEAERKRIADYLRSRAADNWDPSVEAALRQVAHEVDRDHHHGGR